MILSEYDEERHMRQTYEEGENAGKSKVNELFKRLLAAGRLEDFKRSVDDPEFQKKLFEEFDE